MKYKEYPKNIWDQVHKTLDLIQKNNPYPIAAFDADGTLWDVDLGENFFQYQIDNQLIPLPPRPWEHYLEMKKINDDPRAAYLWLAQICKGCTLEQVRNWAHEAFQKIKPDPIFDQQQKLIQLFLSRGVRVFVVTASVKWAVEPGAEFLGLSPSQVLGIETDVQNGYVTETQKGVITYKDGKVEGLLQATMGEKAFFCSGNTEGDLALLESSTHLRLVVSAAARDDHNFKTENKMLILAEERNWLSHRFV